MKTILIKAMLISLALFVKTNLVFSQDQKENSIGLTGEMELNIDLSNMRDTSGRFMLMVGGEMFYPQIEKATITLRVFMKEPRRVFFGFYPNEQLEKNKGKELNDIAALTGNFIEFLGIPGQYKVVVPNSVAEAKIVNPIDHQKKYGELSKLIGNFDNEMLQNYAGLIKQIENTKEAQARDSLIAVYFTHYKLDHPKYYELNVLGFIQNNPDEPASLIELEKYASRSDKDLSSLSLLYNNLNERLKQLPTGKRVYSMIDQDFFSTSLIGKQSPSFMQQDTLGQTWSMDQFKGSVMLLEFWASWCGPCRSSNKNLVKMYRKYKEAGLKIVSISLDSDRTSWLKAVKDDGLDWTNLSDLKGFKNEAATIYHINAIPSNYLIDKSGKVVAVNLDEKQLDAQLERLLK